MEENAQRRVLHINAKHIGEYVEHPGKKNKIAAGIYMGVLDSSPRKLFWGWRWISNSELLFAVCIDEVLNELFTEEDSPDLDVVVKNDGFKKYLTEYVPAWVARGGLKSNGEIPDQYEHWKRVHHEVAISRVNISDVVTDESAKALKDLANRLGLIGPAALRALEGKFDAPPQDWSGDADAFERWLCETVTV